LRSFALFDAAKGVALSDQGRIGAAQGRPYVSRSRNPRPLPDTAHQGRRQDRAATAKGMDAASLILIAVICCLSLLASLWAAFSGQDLGAGWL
jgi:hypothetical protein